MADRAIRLRSVLRFLGVAMGMVQQAILVESMETGDVCRLQALLGSIQALLFRLPYAQGCIRKRNLPAGANYIGDRS